MTAPTYGHMPYPQSEIHDDLRLDDAWKKGTAVELAEIEANCRDFSVLAAALDDQYGIDVRAPRADDKLEFRRITYKRRACYAVKCWHSLTLYVKLS